MAGATYKMGNKVLVNTDIFEAYLDNIEFQEIYEGMAKKFDSRSCGIVPIIISNKC